MNDMDMGALTQDSNQGDASCEPGQNISIEGTPSHLGQNINFDVPIDDGQYINVELYFSDPDTGSQVSQDSQESQDGQESQDSNAGGTTDILDQASYAPQHICFPLPEQLTGLRPNEIKDVGNGRFIAIYWLNFGEMGVAPYYQCFRFTGLPETDK